MNFFQFLDYFSLPSFSKPLHILFLLPRTISLHSQPYLTWFTHRNPSLTTLFQAILAL